MIDIIILLYQIYLSRAANPDGGDPDPTSEKKPDVNTVDINTNVERTDLILCNFKYFVSQLF